MPEGRKGRGRAPPPATPQETAKAATKGQPVKVGNAVLGHLYDAKKGYRPHSYRISRGRVVEIEKLIRYRHGEYVDTEDDIVYAEIVAIHVREPNEIKRWCNHFCPRLNNAQIRLVISRGVAPQHPPRADQVAKMLGVTFAERQALDLRTIGACDVDRKERARIAAESRRERDRERDERRRRKAGAKPRAKFLAESVAAEARRLGVSRQAIYKRRKSMASKALDEKLSGPSTYIDLPKGDMGGGTCQPAALSRPRGVRGVTLLAVRNAERIMVAEAARPTPHQIAASAANRGKLGWHAQLIRNAQALIAAGVDPVEAGDPNIDFEDDAPSAA